MPHHHRTNHAYRVAVMFTAFTAGLLIAWFDRSQSEVQGSALLVMVAAFALALPRQLGAVAVGLLVGIGLPLTAILFPATDVSITSAIALIPGLLGAGIGNVVGRLLNVAGHSLGDDATPETSPAPLPQRLVLTLGLTIVALAGVTPMMANLEVMLNPSSGFIALVWTVTTFVAWVLLTPGVMKVANWVRKFKRSHFVNPDGLTTGELTIHLMVLVAAIVVHSVLLVLLARVLFIPTGPIGYVGLGAAAFRTVSILDPLAYAVIVGLAYAADTERYARDAALRDKVLQAELVAARLTALRSQLNPHFLYNALNAVGTLSQAGRTTETAQVLESLSSMLRYVLDESRKQVPLKDELDFIRQYLAIQQVRFEARLHVSVDCDSELESVLVPPLILQPLVENAVEHGVAKVRSGGTVKVMVQRSGESLLLIVEDDGPGIGNLKESTDGIGLGNTRERLAGLFGVSASVSVTPRDGGGTIAQITLPAESPA